MMTPATLSLAEAAMAKRDTKVSDLRRHAPDALPPRRSQGGIADTTNLLKRTRRTSAHEGARDPQSSPDKSTDLVSK